MTDDEIEGKKQMKGMLDEYCLRTGCKPEYLQNQININDMTEEYRRFYLAGMANATPETEEDKLRWELHVLGFKIERLANKVYWNRMFISLSYIFISILAFIVAFK